MAVGEIGSGDEVGILNVVVLHAVGKNCGYEREHRLAEFCLQSENEDYSVDQRLGDVEACLGHLKNEETEASRLGEAKDKAEQALT
jgi:hypothetical protein